MKWLIAVIYFSTLSVVAGTIYKSIDANGKTVYTDQPPTQGKVTKTLTFADLPSTPIPESVLLRQASLEKSIKKRLSNRQEESQVTLFSAEWCGYCKQAKAYLAEKNIQYRNYDIDTPAGLSAFAEIGAGKGIPVLSRGGKIQRGFSRQGYDAFLSD